MPARYHRLERWIMSAPCHKLGCYYRLEWIRLECRIMLAHYHRPGCCYRPEWIKPECWIMLVGYDRPEWISSEWIRLGCCCDRSGSECRSAFEPG
ncbi:hypothetical protein Nepgr_026434 [Nepenthes gracilis]|uniref:Uncharacterized protein n=1 Tax=Nepenthes gracilis TaxID=150966 RepID=A0AAD3T9R6_NEPGR|nr:hypothetical protein Nepgr_026434 [Nepenthes gracilis]